MSKELERMPCLGNVWLQEFGFLARGLLAGGLLAGGWKGLHALKNKMRPNPAAAAWCSLPNLPVPAGSPRPWRTAWSLSGTGWLSQWVRRKAGCLVCFPSHLRDLDLIGSSVKMKERTSGDRHMD